MKIGLIGYGGIGKWHIEMILKNVNELSIKGIYDIDPKRCELAKEKGFTVYSSLDNILDDKEIELIIIAVPNNFHKEISIAALSKGKHVICEKPVTLNSEELNEVIAIARQYKRIFTIHQNRRWDKDFNIVKKAINEKIINKPFYIESRVQGANGIPGGWRCEEFAGGGMLYDWGVHLIDQILWLVDSPVTEIYAHLLKVSYSVDDNFKLMLRFKNGLSVLIEVGTCSFIPLPRWHVSSDNGTLVINDWSCQGKIVKPKTTEKKWDQVTIYTAAGPTKTMAPRPVESFETVELPEVSVNYHDFYKNVYQAIKGEEELIVKPEQALRVIKVIDAAFESSKYGISIKCEI